jgi:3',5'-cyclic AMP phosphodiesterase CpdA
MCRPARIPTVPRRALLAALLLAAACGPPEATGPLRRSIPVEGPVEFVVIGDFGTGGAAEYRVAAAIRSWASSHPVDALVTTGDNIYDNGHPDRFDVTWERPYGWLDDRGIEVVASIGNHDARTAGGLPVMRLLGMPGPWYSVTMGRVDFVILDGNHPGDPSQRSFLKTSLRRAEGAWQVVVVHQPPFSCGTAHGSEPGVRGLVPAMAGADLALSGHDHTYQRFPARAGTTFVVSGGGGASLDALGECPEGTPRPVAAFADVHHFLYVRATARELRIEAVRVPGSDVGDVVTLSR